MLSSSTLVRAHHNHNHQGIAGIVLKFPTVLFVDIANFHDQYFVSICKRGEGGGAISMIYSTRVVVLPPGGQLDIALQWRGVDTGYASA